MAGRTQALPSDWPALNSYIKDALGKYRFPFIFTYSFIPSIHPGQVWTKVTTFPGQLWETSSPLYQRPERNLGDKALLLVFYFELSCSHLCFLLVKHKWDNNLNLLDIISLSRLPNYSTNLSFHSLHFPLSPPPLWFVRNPNIPGVPLAFENQRGDLNQCFLKPSLENF